VISVPVTIPERGVERSVLRLSVTSQNSPRMAAEATTTVVR
jgi:hypothetical protein